MYRTSISRTKEGRKRHTAITGQHGRGTAAAAENNDHKDDHVLLEPDTWSNHSGTGNPSMDVFQWLVTERFRGTVVGQKDKTYSGHGSGQTLTSLSDSVLCLTRIAYC